MNGVSVAYLHFKCWIIKSFQLLRKSVRQIMNMVFNMVQHCMVTTPTTQQITLWMLPFSFLKLWIKSSAVRIIVKINCSFFTVQLYFKKHSRIYALAKGVIINYLQILLKSVSNINGRFSQREPSNQINFSAITYQRHSVKYCWVLTYMYWAEILENVRYIFKDFEL